MLVRRLQPFQSNIGKRLVKLPKVFVRDSGIVYALLNIGDEESLLGHPVVGASWEGFVMENLVAAAPMRSIPLFCRTAAGAEIDLLLEIPGPWAMGYRNQTRPVGPSREGLFRGMRGCETHPAFRRQLR